jgi:hypothetical protein
VKGLADVQVTLYDIFGYLFVGLVAVASIWILGWALVFPDAALREPHLSSSEWLALSIVAYISGHLVQAIANMVFERTSLKPKGFEAWNWMPPELRKKISQKVGVPMPAKKAPSQEKEDFAVKVLELCDIVVTQDSDAGGDRDIYQYREGFYRGLTVAFSFGVAAVVIRALHSGDGLIGPHARHVVTGWEYLLVVAILGVASWLSYQRYLRFFNYKWHNAFGSFAVATGLISVPKS